jgi:hypothetical protein
MDKKRDYFKKIDFDKTWDENDWEEFFRAQERLSSESTAGAALKTPDRDVELSFRRVLQRFGMDPDNPGTPPAEFDPFLATLDDAPARPGNFWDDGAELEALPIYCQAKCYAYRVLLLCDRHFGKLLTKSYKSKVHRRCQEILGDLQHHAIRIPNDLASGHHLGYGREAIVGNVVRCKRALSHVDACVGLMTRFPRRRFPAGEYPRLLRESLRLRSDLIGWITLLRKRFS